MEDSKRKIDDAVKMIQELSEAELQAAIGTISNEARAKLRAAFKATGAMRPSKRCVCKASP